MFELFDSFSRKTIASNYSAESCEYYWNGYRVNRITLGTVLKCLNDSRDHYKSIGYIDKFNIINSIDRSKLTKRNTMEKKIEELECVESIDNI